MTVGPLSVRGALGGRWSWHPVGWAILMLPGTLIVTLQESAFLRWGLPELLPLIVLSTAAQALTSYAVSGAIAAVARRAQPIMPLSAVAAMYLCVGVVRGVVAGVAAEALTGEQPHFGTRILVWIIFSVVWTPLVVYTVAQIEHRRRLFAELVSVRGQAAQEHDLALVSADQLRDSILVTLRHRISPIIGELRNGLHAVSGQSDAAALELIDQRLGGVAADADSLIAAVSTSADECPAGDRNPAIASLAAALRVELRRPIRTSLLTAAAIVPALVSVVLAPVDVAIPLTAFVALVIATLVSAISATLAVGVGVANQQLADAISRETTWRVRARERAARRDARAQEQIVALTHGPVQGRLAACVMALNFHLASSDRFDPVTTERVTSAVLEHLAAAISDLESTSGLRWEAT